MAPSSISGFLYSLVTIGLPSWSHKEYDSFIPLCRKYVVGVRWADSNAEWSLVDIEILVLHVNEPDSCLGFGLLESEAQSTTN